MRTSSMSQSSAQFSIDGPSNSQVKEDASPSSNSSNWTADRNIDAQMARRAGRINASSISPEEERALNEQRQRLLDRKFAKTISRREEHELKYVEWSLDRIEDAKHGPALDALEEQIAGYETFAKQVQQLEVQLRSQVSRKR
jgi:hypothetical protein